MEEYLKICIEFIQYVSLQWNKTKTNKQKPQWSLILFKSIFFHDFKKLKKNWIKNEILKTPICSLFSSISYCTNKRKWRKYIRRSEYCVTSYPHSQCQRRSTINISAYIGQGFTSVSQPWRQDGRPCTLYPCATDRRLR